jgi:hypothetical protein
MPAERHSPAESDETARESVSAAKKIGRGAEKVPDIRAKSDGIKRRFLLQYQRLSRWLGRQDSNLGMAK